MSLQEIEASIPHRRPMLLLDEIVERQERSIVCRKTFRGDEFFFQGHYPDYPLVPGVILCEAAMQAGAVLLSKFMPDDNAVPVATRLSEVKFKKMVRPGDSIDIDVTLLEQLANAFFLKAKVTVGGKLATRFEFACAAAPKEG
jgi:3-hydroxyacyl-[acyl-carrier-protein] dehydratase